MRKRVIIGFSILIVLIIIFGRNFFPFFFQLIFNRDVNLRQTDNKINILLLGTGGVKHEGPDLTDTIMFVSLDTSKNDITLISIPRDLWAPDLNQKINTAYALGEGKRKGGGLILAKSAVSKILNQPVEYGARLNFDGFVQAVDLVGGLDVDVEKTLDDNQYPIDGKENDPCGHKNEELQALATASSQLEAFPCRYMHIHFDHGNQHLDGKQALEFVRSRHGQGDEGTDFARSRRQEKVIKAFKDKIFSPSTIFNPAKFLSLYAILRGNIDTDIRQDELDDFVRLSQRLKTTKVKSAVLDNGDEERSGLLIHPPVSDEYNFEWVLIPRLGNGNFSEVQKYVECEIKTGDCDIFPNASKNH
jgi:LCP family protein required for cell wall assembly